MKTWAEYVDLLKSGEQTLDITPAPKDENLRADHYRQLAMGLSQGYFLIFQTDPDYPEFVPFENQAFMCQPNPDAIYYYSRVDGKGTYRIVGELGNSIVLNFAIGNKIFGTADKPGAAFNNYDLKKLTLDAEGRFDLILSETRPEGHTGDWLYLNPEADFILLRQFNYDWGRETDLRMAIERLDPVPLRPRMTPEETGRRLEDLMKYSERVANVALPALRRSADQGWINKFHIQKWVEVGNNPSDEWPQSYYETLFEIGPDEALVIEVDMPETCEYWNTQMVDGLWNQVDILYRHSSLNGLTARVQDGKYIAVVAHEDPGYHNWLDTGGNLYGQIIGRWFRASSDPVPAVTRLKLSEVAGFLGDRTPRITPEERKAMMRDRVIGSQLRRKW